MSFSPRGLIACIAGTLLLLMPTASALAAGAGGVEADTGSVSSQPAGGAEYGSASLRPVLRLRALRLVRARVVRGSVPRLAVRIVRPGAPRVRVRMTVSRAHGRTRALTFARVATGRTVALKLPRTLSVGRHRVRILVRGRSGDVPVRSRALTLVVRPRPKPKPKRTRRPAARKPAAQTPPSNAPTTPVPPSLGGPQLSDGVFPVRGAYSLGGDDARFGAGRRGHIHQGQDVLAASGTPVVAPLAGQVLFNDYQAHGAGRYVVLHADYGWEMFFAHCLAGSATLEPGARVNAGDQLCLVGATGDATGPHLHFELWPEGWRQTKGTSPVDPLPQLRRWAVG